MSSVKSLWHASLNGFPYREPADSELTERCQWLEKQNEHLRQEVAQLKSQISGILKEKRDSFRVTKQDIPVEFPSSTTYGAHQRGNGSLGTTQGLTPASAPEPSHTKPRTPDASTPTLGSLMAAAASSAKSSKVETPSPPPPPPLPPLKSTAARDAEVRRLPEVVQLYHWMTRKEARRGIGSASSDVAVNVNARDMIGEIENRSAHLLAIKGDVETKGDFINSLIRKVEKARFSGMEEVEDFLKWLDKELSQLIDERAVLKHFQWPESKTDAMREVAFNYRELKNIIQSQTISCCDEEARQPYSTFLKQMQSLQEKTEQGVYNIQKVRDGAIRRCKEFGIPWEWMLDAGIVSQLKMSSIKIAKRYMTRVTVELKSMPCTEGEDLMLQAVRFAFRVHQFVGGFDEECARAFHEMRNVASSCHSECQQHQHILCQSKCL